MRILIAFLLFATAVPLRGDDATAKVQQALKEQGFYYGDVNGQTTADTSAAIKRYQIRNGLQITGELNDETLQSIRNTPAATPQPVATPTQAQQPMQRPSAPEGDDSEPTQNEAPVQPYAAPLPNRPLPPNPGTVVPSGGGLFAHTPFENAPPDVQRKVIADAQRTLARHGMFKNPADGYFGPELEFSLRAYQSRVGLQTTGQLDLGTLAALELLPGAHTPVYTPRRRPAVEEPPVRGEWIRP